MTDQQTKLEWRADAVPVSCRFGDPYYSLADGLAEARHVFLAGNGLPERLRAGFHIAELGFGTGLNLLATLEAAQNAPTSALAPIHFTSFEAYPMAPADMERALAAFPGLRAAALVERWAAGARRFDLGPLRVQVVIGDARATVPRWDGRADAWYLDGFAPARNPELWTPELLAEVARHTAPGGSFATYTAAGAVRRALAAAGFAVERVPGHGRKRHMSRGQMR